MVARLCKLVVGVTSLQQVWRMVRGGQMVQEDVTQEGTSCAEAKAGLATLTSLLGDKDLLAHCCLLSSTRMNRLLSSATLRLALPALSETVSAAVLVSPLVVEAGRMAVVTLSVRPELRGHSGSQYCLGMVQEQHRGRLELGAEVLSSSGQGRLTLTLTNTGDKRLKLAAGSVFGMVRRIEDMDVELENEMLRGGRVSVSEEDPGSEGEEEESSSESLLCEGYEKPLAVEGARDVP